MFKRKRKKILNKPRTKRNRHLQSFFKGVMKRSMRRWYSLGGNPRLSEAGFVLQTTIMVLLVLSLVVGSILIRSGQQSQQTIGSRESKIVYNAATPAVDRAKAKIEYLFEQDPGLPNTVPSEEKMSNLMLVDSRYTLPGETRLDVNKDNKLDNAWAYETDIDGDGQTETVAYSIFMKTAADTNNDGTVDIQVTSDNTSQKASNLLTRSGPLAIKSATGSSTNCPIPELQVESGWYAINDASLRKSFQIDAVVANKKDANRSVTAVELQQDRQMDRGNKWAAWFRYDLELFPGPDFNWNGAMHTGGNLMVGQQSDRIKFRLVSSPKSCLYTEDASEITLAQYGSDDNPEFQGQVMAFSSTANTFTGNARVDLFPGVGTAPSTGTSTSLLTLNKDSDSVVNPSGATPYGYSLNPITLFTEDKSESRASDKTNASYRDANWKNQALNKRIFNKRERQPYIDDTYRADDRYGPKPKYVKPGSNFEKDVVADDYDATDESGENGKLITESTDILINNTPPETDLEDVGLDGYWERRARNEGLRLIVGQRLELGNIGGWQGNNDPLYPINASVNSLSSGSNENENRQRKSLRDNLAAVQAMAVYHRATSLDFPIACVALTSHPGTQQSITNSTTFDSVTISGTSKLTADFLTGKGTNGWEFKPPGNVTTASSFKAKIDEATDPLRIALSNLAYFAGDPDGAFPPKQETAPGNIHPYPQLAMWGNFSNLRRVIKLLDAGTDYDNLSLADKSTLHTAACTVGMLAYNVKNNQDLYNSVLTDSTGMTAFAEHMWQLVDGNESNGEVNLLISPQVPFPTGYNRANDAADFYAQFTTDDFIEAMEAEYNAETNSTQKAKIAEYVSQAKILASGIFIDRDRVLGFAPNSPIVGSGTSDIVWDATTGAVTIDNEANEVTLKMSCDPNTFDAAFSDSDGGLDEKKVGLSVGFCAPNNQAKGRKYPPLYYLFPVRNHDQVGINPDTNVTYDDQPTGEEYIAQSYIFNTTAGVNKNYTYKVVGDNDNDGVEETGEDSLSSIALDPRAIGNWKLPYSTTETNIGNKITNNGTSYYVPFLDKGMYNGREMLAVRVLDLDLDMMRNSSITSEGGWKPAIENWLPASGLVYAFREDAIREDAIARPASKSWADCNTEAKLTTADASCRIKVTTPQDPPLNATTGVSPKPVDFYADPDRRPHGFRLRKGSILKRDSNTASDNPFPNRGLSFISDNPVYIKGNFNEHKDNSGNKIEEFTSPNGLLADNWSNFYTRGTGTSNGSLNTNFAKPAYDKWRPSEILTDALTVLSGNFCDGTIESGIRNDDAYSDCNGTGQESSYRNSTTNGNSSASNFKAWVRENLSDSNSPIKLDRNGRPLYTKTNASGEFAYTGKNLMSAGRTITNVDQDYTVNTIFVSGLVPSRVNQSYGGLHNFPRFLENWNSDDLFISGSFVQLNFSTYATAPFDLEPSAWEPGGSGANGESLPFYSPPNRRWGYDVALQYNPPGPVAKRFISRGTPRSEFYKELAADDPYVKLLRCATLGTSKVDQKATDCS
jgi:hypothetical protein